MMPQGMDGRIDLATRSVLSHVLVQKPGPAAPPEELQEVGRMLDTLSADGYAIITQTDHHLVLGRTVRMEKIQLDISRVVIPLTAPLTGGRA